ncbi:MAG TPA: hypothetical protein VM925_27100 [Labilithrix sp.]|nr:hypothetical protein [Labilithrix sp.]
MSFTLAPLLIHDEHVPARARDALRAAYEAGPFPTTAMLESAARVLHAETDLECRDVRELVGLPEEGGCV